MSAGSSNTALMVNRDLDRLAPRFAAAVRAAIAVCNGGANGGLRAMVYEGYRSAQLQALYYQRGRTIKPPAEPVTYAPSHLHSWHGFGLAVDVVHRDLFWRPPGGAKWFKDVAMIFEKSGCTWGGNWTRPDPPHFQWKHCPPSPSDSVRKKLEDEGLEAVWQALHAIDPAPSPTPQLPQESSLLTATGSSSHTPDRSESPAAARAARARR